MAKKVDNTVSTNTNVNAPIITEVIRHYLEWTMDNQKRRTRPNGWDAITDAYWGKLPNDWPYQSKVVDPRIRTTLLEKKARLLNQKLRGRLVPREGGDELKARVNNAILDFQWDNANDGGTMLSKWGAMDQDTRMYASRFALTKWRHEEDSKGNVLFDGNEFYPLDIRDTGVDASFTHVRNAKWVQVREWAKVEDMEKVNDLPNGKKIYPGLPELQATMLNSNNRRDNAYPNRILQIKGLVDRVGEDKSFPVVELVTEYRKDRWITFSPRYKVILRDIPNPYKHGKIPVVQLRYYSVTGDGWGESEIEPVLPLWKAIQAILCGYLDNMNVHNRPPLKIIDSAVRIETIVFGPEAQWSMDRPDAVTEFQGSNSAMQYFQTAYSSAVSAFNTAMGDTSQGVSAVDPFNPQKTATEVQNSAKQQNTRDQDNQTQLSEALQDMMSMWLANNQQFLFADSNKQEYIMRILGTDLFNYFKRAGLDEQELTIPAMKAIGDIIQQQDGNVSDQDLQTLVDAGKTPKFPVQANPSEKNPKKQTFKPKMTMGDMGNEAEITVVPEDLEGTYDYIPDVKSMSAGSSDQLQQARTDAINRLTTNPIILQQLQAQGVTPDIKELLIADLENAGLTDAERYFPQSQPNIAGQVGPGGAPQPNVPVGGLQGGPVAGPQGSQQPQVPQPVGLPQPGGVPQGV